MTRGAGGRTPVTRWAVCAGLVLACMMTPNALAGTMCYEDGCAPVSGCDAEYSRCKACQGGYWFDATGDGFCLKCTDPLCGKCGPPGVCHKCAGVGPEYTLVYKDAAGVCRASNVSANGDCLAVDAHGRCSKHANPKPPCTLPNCETCAPGGKACAKCLDVYYDDDFAEVPSDVVYRAADGTCRLCAKHRYDTGCRACNATGACTRCTEGYRLDTGGCKPCADGLCKTCAANLTTCLACMDSLYDDFMGTETPVYRDRKGECSTCNIKGCARCDADGKCFECDIGVLRRGTCVPCDAVNPMCLECDQHTGYCSYCGTGGILDLTDSAPRGAAAVRGACVPCASKYCTECVQHDPARCLRCLPSTNQSDPDTPTIYLDRANRCRKCTEPGCALCRSNGRCQTCKPGYRRTTALTCAKCPPGCSECTPLGSCPACLAGYTTDGAGGCKACPGCLPCSNPGCQKCSTDGTRCVRCDASSLAGRDPQCRTCTGANCGCSKSFDVCDSCLDEWDPSFSFITRAFWLDRKANKCRPCSNGCVECGASGCKQCDDSGNSISLLPGGATTSVVSGWRLINGVCKPCADPLCYRCDATLKKCLECVSQDPVTQQANVYMDRQGHCRTCDLTGCQDDYTGSPSCTRDGRCKACSQGFIKVGGKCVVMPP